MFALIVVGLIYLNAVAFDVSAGAACLDQAETAADLDACRGFD